MCSASGVSVDKVSWLGRNRRDFARCYVKQSLAVKTFEDLFAELGDRARTRPAGSATVAALDGGIHGLGKKILEEAGEVWLAAEHEPKDRKSVV